MPLKIYNYDNIYWRHSSKHEYMAIDYSWRLHSQKIPFISSVLAGAGRHLDQHCASACDQRPDK